MIGSGLKKAARAPRGRPAQASNDVDWQTSSAWVKTGRRVVLGVVAGAVILSTVLSISGAVVATGSVTVESSYQQVQHPTGGVVSQILVKNGDFVRADQPLLRLDETRAEADLGVVSSRAENLTVQSARLIAERDSLETFRLPKTLDASKDNVQQVFEAQQALFRARRKTRLGEQSVLDQRLRQLEGEIRSLKSQRDARRRERDITRKELSTVLPLFDRGYVSRQRVAPLQRDAARLDGDLGRLEAELGKMESAIAETELRKQQAEKQFLNEVVTELSRVSGALEEQRLELDKLRDTLKRTTIVAPKAGFVHDLQANTIGGVIQPGRPIAQIIPDGDTLIVEAKVAARQIDRVHTGQVAFVTFPAFNARTTPRLEGTLTRLSPAEIVDQQGRATYTARIRIPPAELLRIGRGHRLIPGMPAEVFIETTSRSILSYILKPLTDAMGQAFRER
ncbi:MAG: HlyD family type I secretion periplasmic adaptor subunit [Pseudomonadota bacterium]